MVAVDVKPAGRLRITVPHDRGEGHLGNGFGKPRGEGVAERVPVRIRNSRRPRPLFPARLLQLPPRKRAFNPYIS